MDVTTRPSTKLQVTGAFANDIVFENGPPVCEKWIV